MRLAGDAYRLRKTRDLLRGSAAGRMVMRRESPGMVAPGFGRAKCGVRKKEKKMLAKGRAFV